MRQREREGKKKGGSKTGTDLVETFLFVGTLVEQVLVTLGFISSDLLLDKNIRYPGERSSTL